MNDEAILVENWDGEPLLLPLIREIMDKEHDLIGDERDRILWYTGCAQLVNWVRYSALGKVVLPYAP